MNNSVLTAKYESWSRFEYWLHLNEMTAMDFTVQCGLGFYATREWKRRDRVPLMAIEVLTANHRARLNAVTKVGVTTEDLGESIAGWLDPDEYQEWLTLEQRRKTLIGNALQKKAEDERLAQMTKSQLAIQAFPEWARDPKKDIV